MRLATGSIKAAGAAVAACVLVAAAALTAPGCSDEASEAPDLEDPSATARELVSNYVGLLARKDTAELTSFLSEAYTALRDDGVVASREELLAAPPSLTAFQIQDVSAKQDGNELVVFWTVKIEGTGGVGSDISEDHGKRLSTFVWNADDGRWRMVSHVIFPRATATATPAR